MIDKMGTIFEWLFALGGVVIVLFIILFAISIVFGAIALGITRTGIFFDGVGNMFKGLGRFVSEPYKEMTEQEYEAQYKAFTKSKDQQ